MNMQASFSLRGRNPDVLTCIANFSNDEVFTPPELANRMLDTLAEAWVTKHKGASLWADKTVRFLDPFTKSGVFLREITSRLTVGLAQEIPDLQERVNHILTKQVFGIGITRLTSLLARRSVYCSKYANGAHSVAKGFASEAGNIWFERTDHRWVKEKCTFCGAGQASLDRGEGLETHAYAFIHTDNINTRLIEIFGGNMQFDVIIGNPPYQLNDGGGTGSSARPIYHEFVAQAKKLDPRYLSMVIPARWYSGGKGLDDFREEMLNDERIVRLVDYADSRECFPGVDIAGGVCYFLWDQNHAGSCVVETVRREKRFVAERSLNEHDSFVRDNLALEIVKKVKVSSSELFLDSMVSSRMPFGLPSNVLFDKGGDLTLIASSGEGNIERKKITAGLNLIDKWKVMLSKASNDHGGQPDKKGTRRIFSRVEVIGPGTVCTESYLIVGVYERQADAMNMMNYLKTQFCRFLVSTILLTQNITKNKFVFVPALSMDREWNDEQLFRKYQLTDEEIEFIGSTIRPM